VSKEIVIRAFDDEGRRIDSKTYDELVRQALEQSSHLVLETFGQHNIGCRLHKDEPITLEVRGPVGQRLGAMGMPGTTIVCHGPASDDVGYLNIGADIVVKGDATNGVCNAMAAGRVMIGGSIGARGLTMTKWNPAYERPELWVLGSVGDTFAEFNCGGVAVVCGVEPKRPGTVLGYRPCVGMVGGWIFFRGEIDDTYAANSARLTEVDDERWEWLMARMPEFLESIGRSALLETLSRREEWRLLLAISPEEKRSLLSKPMSMAEFRAQHWDRVFPGGDPLADLAPDLDRSPIPVIPTGELRRKAPHWRHDGETYRCRDCHLCETICPQAAIRRRESGAQGFVYESLDDRCIGCGFCRDVCPASIWIMRPLP